MMVSENARTHATDQGVAEEGALKKGMEDKNREQDFLPG